jgi:mono/diheme cytochrome c family protein
MKRLLVAAVVAAVGSPAWGAPPPTSGADLYKKNCASCHGADGKGGSAPAIAGKLPGDVAKVVTAHPPPMSKIELSADDTAANARYVGSLKKK